MCIRDRRRTDLSGSLYVRVNEPVSKHYLRDIEAAVACDIDGIIVPKLEARDQLLAASLLIERAEGEPSGKRRIDIMLGIESIAGVIDAVRLCAAHERIGSAYFGAEDFASDIGARRTQAGEEVLYARSRVVLAAKSAGIVAIDQAVVEIRDEEQYRRDAEKGRDLGYGGKICVVPRQVDICNEVFAPTETEVAHARELMAVYEDATSRGLGTIDHKGKMIDGPLVKRAQAVLDVARLIKARG